MNRVGFAICVGALILGCAEYVPRARYESTVQRLETTRAELRVEEHESARAKADEQHAREQLTAVRASLSETAAADQSQALYAETVRRLDAEIHRGDLRVERRDGAVVITFPNDVLFDTGRSDLRGTGTRAVVAASYALAQLPIRDLQVASHTLDLRSKVAPNWELSSARAATVLRALLARNVEAKRLSVAGYSDADRDDQRRTEIIVHLFSR